MRFIVILVTMLVFLSVPIHHGRASPKAVPPPNTVWVSGASGSYAPRAGMICWGDRVGTYIGPIAVKFWRDTPTTLIEFGACEVPRVSVEDRAVWLTNFYGREFISDEVDRPTATSTTTNSPTKTPSRTLTSTKTSTVTFTPSLTSTISQTPTVTDTLTPSETGTATNTSTETLTPSITFTRTFTRTRTWTPSRTNTRTKTYTVTKSVTRSRTSTLTASKTPTLTVLKAVIVNWTSKGKVVPIKVEERWICWGQINGVNDIVVYYRVGFYNPENVLGGCQTKPIQSTIDIVNYFTRTTGRPWKLISKP